LAKGLGQALDLKPGALTAMGQDAKEVSEQCTWRHAVQAYLDIYKSVVANFSRA
jgi:hypothetical protein